MPGCVLRVRAKRSVLRVEPVSTPDNSFNYSVDDGDFASQVEAAIAFLQKYAGALKAANVDGSCDSGELDFGVSRDDEKFAHSFRFPPTLISLAAACNVTLCLTSYIAARE